MVAEADALQSNLNLAGRLVGGLADENVRWKKNVQNFKEEKLLLVGDTLVADQSRAAERRLPVRSSACALEIHPGTD